MISLQGMVLLMKKIVFSFVVICFVVFMFGINMNVIAADNDTIYISSSGNDANSGTSKAPVKTINRALELVTSSKKTIQVLDDVYILDTTNNDKPLVINKSVTIRGDSSLPTIISRAGGIVLGADVTFKDVRLGTASYIRPGIAANGHTLRLENVHNDSTLRPLQVYGGTFIDYTTLNDYGSGVRGTISNIYITGGSYEAIYAGSGNGNINMPVNIIIDKGSSFNCGGIYVASTVKNPADTSTSGKSPVINKSMDITSAINISIKNNAYVGIVDGVKPNRNVSLTINGSGTNSSVVNYIDNITVESGTFIIKEGSTFGNVSGDSPNVTLTGISSNKATLDISKVVSDDYNITVNNFSGSSNGIFVVNRDYTTTIRGTLTGTGIEFRTSNGMPWSSSSMPGYSGWIEYDMEYIITNGGSGSFVINNPYPNQEDIKFTSGSSATDGFTTVEGEGFMPPELISFKPISQTVSEEDINKVVGGVGQVNINVEVIYSDEEIFTDLSFVPFYYTISYKDKSGKIIDYKKQESVCDEDGYYKCNYTYSTASAVSSQVMMKLEPAGSSINISKVGTQIKAGTYTISLTATTTSGVVTKKFTLTVQGEKEDDENVSSSGNDSSSNTSGSASGGVNQTEGNTNKKPENTHNNVEENDDESQTTTMPGNEAGNETGNETDNTPDNNTELEGNVGNGQELTKEELTKEEASTDDHLVESDSSENAGETSLNGNIIENEGSSEEKLADKLVNRADDNKGSGEIIVYALLAVALGGIITGVIFYIKRLKKPSQ